MGVTSDSPLETMGIPVLHGEAPCGFVPEGDAFTTPLADHASRLVFTLGIVRAVCFSIRYVKSAGRKIAFSRGYLALLWRTAAKIQVELWDA